MTMTINKKDQSTEAAAIAAIVAEAKGLEVQTIDPKEGAVYIVPDRHGGVERVTGRSLLAPYDKRPLMREGEAEHETLDSLIAWTNRFKIDDESALFAFKGDKTAPVLRSVIDYHQAGAERRPPHLDDDESEAATFAPTGRAGFRKHRGTYRFPLSEEWKIWNGPLKFSQHDFAVFLEDRIMDVVPPKNMTPMMLEMLETLGLSESVIATPARLLELSRGLEIRVSSKATQVVRLATGEAHMAFSSEHQDERGQALKVPLGFVIAISVFEGEGPYLLFVRLKYSLNGGEIRWSLELTGASKAFDKAFTEACDKAQKGVGLPLFFGKPE